MYDVASSDDDGRRTRLGGVTAFGVSHYESTAKLHVKAPPVRPPVEFLLGAEPRDEGERLLLMQLCIGAWYRGWKICV